MLTYEDTTENFLKAAHSLGLVTHPEYWLNIRTLEREFACTCHTGLCEDAEVQSSCTVAFTWGALDSALSLSKDLQASVNSFMSLTKIAHTYIPMLFPR